MTPTLRDRALALLDTYENHQGVLPPTWQAVAVALLRDVAASKRAACSWPTCGCIAAEHCGTADR